MQKLRNEFNLIAETAQDFGISIIPVKSDGSKKPAIPSWSQYQKEIVDFSTLSQWFPYYNQEEDFGIAVVCGSVSDNLECLDFDSREIFEQWSYVCEKSGLEDLVERVRSGYFENSPNGYHVLYRCHDATLKQQKLASTKENKTLIETRAEGGYVIISPSKGYQLISGGLDSIEVITAIEREQLHTVARHLCQAQKKQIETTQTPSAPSDENRVGDWFNERARWEDILKPHGWALWMKLADKCYWTRPNKAHGTSAVSGGGGQDRLQVFTTSSNLDAGSYDKFGAYVRLTHGGDFKKATAFIAEKNGLKRSEEPKVEKTHKKEKSKQKKEQLDFVELVLDQVRLVHANSSYYAYIEPLKAMYCIESQEFKNWASQFLKSNFNFRLDDSKRSFLVSALCGDCMGLPQTNVYRRIAADPKNKWSFVLHLEKDSCAWISPGKVEFKDRGDLNFHTSTTAKPLPIPEILDFRNIERLWKYCNIQENDRVLVLAWLLESLRPDTKYPVLSLTGAAGSAKSTTQRFLVQMIDPNRCSTTKLPSNDRDFYVLAVNTHVIGLENISFIHKNLQDTMCMLSTGSELTKKKNYTDSELDVLSSQNPIILNGISLCITAPDLIDRAICIDIEKNDHPTSIAILEEEFKKDHALMFGALLDLYSKCLCVLPNLPKTCLDQSEAFRMMEYSHMCWAVAEVLGMKSQDAMLRLMLDKNERQGNVVDNSALAHAIIAFFKGGGQDASHTASTWLVILSNKRTHLFEGFPKSPAAFGSQIARLKSGLLQKDIEVKRISVQGQRKWSIKKL